jgi:hypothetical protein
MCKSPKFKRFLKYQARFLKNLESDYNLFRSKFELSNEFIQRDEIIDPIFASEEWIESPIAAELQKLNNHNRVSSSHNELEFVVQIGPERLDSFSRDKEIQNRLRIFINF